MFRILFLVTGLGVDAVRVFTVTVIESFIIVATKVASPLLEVLG